MSWLGRAYGKPLSERLAERSKVNPLTGCHEWQGALDKDGYGKILADGQQMRSHRASWMLKNGPIAEGLVVCHRCDNPPCINPEHLFLGTPGDNVRDRIAKGRFIPRPPHKPGEKNPAAILTSDQVRSIRREYVELGGRKWGAGATKQLCEKYGVTPTTVHRILNGKGWKVLDDPGRQEPEGQ